MRVAIYARVSRADRDDPNSIPVQLADCRQRADEEGWEVLGEYVDEGISGWNPKKRRPEYERLLADLEAGRFDAPLVRDHDRLLRQDKEGTRWLDLYAAGKVRHLKYVDEADIDLTRARDRKEFKDRVSAAVFYSDRLSEKIRSTMRRKATRGEWSGGGRRPFGYRVVADGSRYRLEVDPDEAALIRGAARAVLAGASLYSIVREWNVAGKPSGGRWTSHDVRRVLLSPQVAGLRGEVEATWEPILARDERRLLLARLPGGNGTGARPARRHALAGLLRCAECGGLLSGKVNRRRLRSGGAVDRRAYVCNGANGGCGKVAITAPALERYLIEAALERLGPEPDHTPVPVTTEDATVLRELVELEERKRALGVAYADGLMDAGQVRAATDRLAERIADLQPRLAVGPARPTFRWARTVPGFFAFLDGSASELPPEEVETGSEFLRDRIARVTVSPARRPGVRFDPGRVEVVWK